MLRYVCYYYLLLLAWVHAGKTLQTACCVLFVFFCVVVFLFLLIDCMEPHTGHDVHTVFFLELPTTCLDMDGDGTATDAYNCPDNGGALTRAKASPDACSGECQAAQCCGMCVIIICYYWPGFARAKN